MLVRPMLFRLIAFAVALIVGGVAARACANPVQGRRRAGSGGTGRGGRSAADVAMFAAWPAGLALLSLLVPRGDWAGLGQLILLAVTLAMLALGDLRTLSVDTRLIVAGLSLRMLSLALVWPQRLQDMILGMLCGAGVLVLVGVFYRTLRGREGLGEGDASVMGLVGAFVGWQGVFPALAMAAASGLLVAIPGLWLSRKPLSTAVPFVPFLALGGLLVYGLQQWHGWPWPMAAVPHGWPLAPLPAPLR